MQPRIFIGSSSEGLKIAEYIKSILMRDFEVCLWTDEIFKYNDSFLDTLLKASSLFDFGIMVATKDDYNTSRNVSFETPRDNIIFEFGLFLGRLGPSRTFVVQEKGAKLPSDLLGISVPQFEICDNLRQSISLNKEIDIIKRTIEERQSLGELGLLPSTPLAIGYFENFIAIVCDTLMSNNEMEVEGKTFTKFKLNIVMPTDLDKDIKKRAIIYFKRNKLSQIPIPAMGRNFPIFVTYDDKDTDLLQLYDMPTTLSGIDKAIELFMQKGHIGKSIEQKLLEERELRNFQTTLQNLIDNDAYSRDLVQIIKEK